MRPASAAFRARVSTWAFVHIYSTEEEITFLFIFIFIFFGDGHIASKFLSNLSQSERGPPTPPPTPTSPLLDCAREALH